MQLLIPTLIVLHVLPAAFWFGVTGVLARLGPEGAALPLKGPQFGSAAVAIVFGAVLWGAAHIAFGVQGQVLATGAICALGGLLLQHVAWRAAGRSPRTFAGAQRGSALLVALALIAMLVFPFVA